MFRMLVLVSNLLEDLLAGGTVRYRDGVPVVLWKTSESIHPMIPHVTDVASTIRITS